MAKKKTSSPKKAAPIARSTSGKGKGSRRSSKPARKKEIPISRPKIIKRYPTREIERARNEKTELRKEIRKVNRKFDREERKTYQDKLRKEKRSIEKKLDGLDRQIKQSKNFIKFRDEKNRDKKNIQSKISRREKKLDKLYENKNWDEYKKLNNETIRLQLKANEIDRQLGRVPKKGEGIPPKPEKVTIKEDKRGGVTETLSVWDGARRLKGAIKAGEFKYYVINGQKFSSEDASIINAVASDIWKNANAPGGSYNVKIRFNADTGYFHIDNI